MFSKAVSSLPLWVSIFILLVLFTAVFLIYLVDKCTENMHDPL
jgi:hypothetical protein